MEMFYFLHTQTHRDKQDVRPKSNFSRIVGKMQTQNAPVDCERTEDAIERATSATSAWLLVVTKEALARLMLAAQRAQDVLDRLVTQHDFTPDPEQFAALSKQKFTPGSATLDAVRKSRLALTTPRDGSFFRPAQAAAWTVSNPSSPFLALGTKGCAGPNVVQPLAAPISSIDAAPLNVIRPALHDTAAALREADAACDASLASLLDAYAVLIERTQLLDSQCKTVLLKLLEVVRTAAPAATADYGFELIAMFQGLGDATFPWPHFQHMLRIRSADKVAAALTLYFDTAQVHAALRAYCAAQASYADSMAESYRAKFVPLKHALRVAEHMQRGFLAAPNPQLEPLERDIAKKQKRV